MEKYSERGSKLGVFALVLLGGSSCNRDFDSPPDESKELFSALSVPVPAPKQFVVLSRMSASFGQRCIVSGGDIALAASADGEPLNVLSAGNDARLGVGEVLLARPAWCWAIASSLETSAPIKSACRKAS